MFNLKQDYASYTPEDYKVWKLLFRRQMENFPGRAATEFLEGLERVGFTEGRPPDFDETNAVLRQTTGWSVEVVPGLIPDREFFELLAARKFPATTWLRKLEELDYLEEPDMFHDVFAHVPLLSNRFFVDFLQQLARIALRHINNPFAIEMIGRLYWFTVEFGLIREDRGLRIYGAGILSSPGETVYCLEDQAVRHEYDVRCIMEHHYYKHAFQDRYYVIDSYEQLYGSVGEVAHWVDVAVRKYPECREDVSQMDVVLA